MSDIQNILAQGAQQFGIPLDEEALQRFQTYCDMLLDWNTRVNLTAIKVPEEVAVKHFVDSITLLYACDVPKDAKVIDVGTGAGFPGVPLKIVRNDIQLTLLDSLNKRLIFLNDLMHSLRLDATLVHARAEEGGLQVHLREKFDFAASRAVASLNLLAEYCLPYVKIGGVFAAMKGQKIEEELESSQKAIAMMGGKVKEIKEFILPDNSSRTIVVIEKISATPAGYPRHGSKIAKKPL